MPSPFATKYKPEEKAAILYATLDEGMTVVAAVEAAKNGHLPGCGAFEMPLATARNLRQAERRRREGKNLSPAARMENGLDGAELLARRTVSHLERKLDRLESGNKHVEPSELEGILKPLKLAVDIFKGTQRDKPQKTEGKTSVTESLPSSQLLKAAQTRDKERGRPRASGPNPTVKQLSEEAEREAEAMAERERVLTQAARDPEPLAA